MGKNFRFLQPRLANVVFTILVLCLPLLREQYNNGQYVTWHRPIVLIFGYLQNLQNQSYLQALSGMVVLSLVIYFVVSVVIAGILFLTKKSDDKNKR